MLRIAIPLAAVLMLASGCNRELPAPATPATQAAPATQKTTTKPRVVFLGDSLTAGLGVEQDQAFPARVAEQLKAAGIDATVVNAGTSGDTTAGGLAKLDWLLQQKTSIVVVGLGGNDGLRGLDVDASAANLRRIVGRSKSAGADVLLLGMQIPTNYGPEYREKFAAMYPAIAKEYGATLVPFVLEGVGGVPSLNQPDGIHPTAEGHRLVAATVLETLRPMVDATINRAATRPAP